MYKKIMVPVDLAHVERIEKALQSAADLSKHYGIPVCYASVTSSLPSHEAHNPKEYEQKLQAFGQQQAEKYGLQQVESHSYISHDPAVDLDKKLIEAAHTTGSDLIVMASHVPGLPDHIFSSNAGSVAYYADVSVFVIR